MTAEAEGASPLESQLSSGLSAGGLVLAADAQAKLVQFVALLEKWNRVYNLTAIREPERMVTHHLLDSLSVLPWLDGWLRDRGCNEPRLLDVGSGGGLPGIPLAIARPQWRVTLIDSSHKKGSFLVQAAAELGLSNVDVRIGRVEDASFATGFDIVMSRAFADLAMFATLAGRHLVPGGALVAMKGLHPAEEIAELPAPYRVVATPQLDVPGLGAARHLIVIQPKDAA